MTASPRPTCRRGKLVSKEPSESGGVWKRSLWLLIGIRSPDVPDEPTIACSELIVVVTCGPQTEVTVRAAADDVGLSFSLPVISPKAELAGSNPPCCVRV
jgi:hypothetical protein